MGIGQRDETGHWTVTPEEGDYPVFIELLARQLNALDPLFERAREASEFEFILCLLRVYGAQDAGWDPYETTLRAIPRIRELIVAADAETAKHLGLWVYGHVFEASEPYELLANLIRVGDGGRYQVTSAFPARGNRPASPGEKIQQLQTQAAGAGFSNSFVPLRDAWDRALRNAAFHADYTIRREGLRILNPARQYSWDDYDRLVNGALAYHAAFSRLYRLHVARYDQPVEIQLHPDFSGDPDERAVVMVRENHGVIGLKDAWTSEEIKQGKIPFRVGRFSSREAKMAENDPNLALFPASES